MVSRKGGPAGHGMFDENSMRGWESLRGISLHWMKGWSWQVMRTWKATPTPIQLRMCTQSRPSMSYAGFLDFALTCSQMASWSICSLRWSTKDENLTNAFIVKQEGKESRSHQEFKRWRTSDGFRVHFLCPFCGDDDPLFYESSCSTKQCLKRN